MRYSEPSFATTYRGQNHNRFLSSNYQYFSPYKDPGYCDLPYNINNYIIPEESNLIRIYKNRK